VAGEEQRLKELRLQLAKRNRGIVAIERKLDAIPDRTELAQYQRRFHELHNEMSGKHLETKQYYTLYNTLNDKKRYLEKELALLNSICEAYNEGMMSPHGREDFIRQFESIVDGVKSAQDKVRHKYISISIFRAPNPPVRFPFFFVSHSCSLSRSVEIFAHLAACIYHLRIISSRLNGIIYLPPFAEWELGTFPSWTAAAVSRIPRTPQLTPARVQKVLH